MNIDCKFTKGEEESSLTGEEKTHTLYPREGSFAGLDSLEWLKLEDNAISALSGGDLFPASLKVTCQQLAFWKEVKYSRSK